MIIIKEVRSRRDRNRFIDFPVHLYKDNPYYVPTLAIDEKLNMDQKKNPAYEHSEACFWLAYRDKKIVGRIGGIINHKYNEKMKVKQVRFTRFDVIDDIEVTKVLFDQVLSWGKEKGMTDIVGPIGFSDLDKQGMLVDGFEEMNLFITLYNHPYYLEHMTKLGFVKDVDWVEYQIPVPDTHNERLDKLSHAIQKRYGYRMIEFKKKKEVLKYIYDAFGIVNEAFDHLYGVVALTPKQIDFYVKQYIALINLDFVYIVVNEKDEVIGFGLLGPSLSNAARKSKGHLFPFGWIHVLRGVKKYDVLDMYTIAVKPEYQNKGINALILHEGIKKAIEKNVKFCETGPELELNNQVQSQWKDFDARQHRRRRCFKRTI